MHRSHADHRRGLRRIHIELDETEIYGLLRDLNPAALQNFGFARELIDVLREARDDFERGAAPQHRNQPTT